jgi:Transglycosylase SLT domain
MIEAAIVLKMAMAIAPGAEKVNQARQVIATVATVAETKHDAALLLYMAWKESRFNKNAVGDAGLALGAWQLHSAPRSVLWDLPKAASITLARLRYSETACPAFPLAVYASGNCKQGHTVSNARMAEVTRIEHSVE